MRMSNRKGLVDPSAKRIPLELAHPSCDLNSTGHERAGPLRPHHLKVIVDHSEGGAQDTELVTLHLKISPHLGEIHSQLDRNALGLQLLGRLPFELGLEGTDFLLCVVVLLAGLVMLLESLITLLASHAAFRAEPPCAGRRCQNGTTDPLEVGADGCELNGGGYAEAGNLSIGGNGVAAEARMHECIGNPKG